MRISIPLDLGINSFFIPLPLFIRPRLPSPLLDPSVTFRLISLKLQEFNIWNTTRTSSTSTTLFCDGTSSSNLRSVTSFPQVPPSPIPPSVCETSSFSGFNSLSPSHGLTIPTLFKFTSSPLPRFNVYTQLNKQQNQKHPQCVIMGQGHSPVYQQWLILCFAGINLHTGLRYGLLLEKKQRYIFGFLSFCSRAGF